jgi:hypothetical protein
VCAWVEFQAAAPTLTQLATLLTNAESLVIEGLGFDVVNFNCNTVSFSNSAGTYEEDGDDDIERFSALSLSASLVLLLSFCFSLRSSGAVVNNVLTSPGDEAGCRVALPATHLCLCCG